jgi:hypothetical protein
VTEVTPRAITEVRIARRADQSATQADGNDAQDEAAQTADARR